MKKSIHGVLVVLLCLLVPAVVMAGGGREQTQPAAPAASPAPAAPAAPAAEPAFDLEALIAAAQAEGRLVVYDTSSRITRVAENFQALYGIQVSATKMGNPEQIERVRREVDAGNVQVDVIGVSDAPTLINDLIPRGYVSNWIPPDMVDLIPQEYQYPLTYRLGQRIIGYNSDSYPQSPISNIWELTEERWRGRIMMRDPAVTPATIAFFATMTTPRYAAMLEQAYRTHYGRALQTREANAGWEFLKQLFANRPVVFRSDDDVGEAVGAAGQQNAPIGLYVYTKHRDNENKNLRLTAALNVQPFIGYVETTNVAIVNGGPNPNAAKLFVRFLMREEGVGPWVLEDLGSYSPNPEVGVHAEDELG